MGASRKCPDMVGARMERAVERGDTSARGPQPPARRAGPAAFKGLGALGAPRPPPAPPLPAPSRSGAEGAEPESPGHRHRGARARFVTGAYAAPASGPWRSGLRCACVALAAPSILQRRDRVTRPEIRIISWGTKERKNAIGRMFLQQWEG